jgi:hypothetical protein
MTFVNCRITYSGSSYVDVPISRWDEDNWGITIEAFMESGNRNTLFANVVPGAVKELYNILGTPTFQDLTWESGNTWTVEPLDGYGLSSLRQGREIAVKSISDTFINKDYFLVKVEGKRLDT